MLGQKHCFFKSNVNLHLGFAKLHFIILFLICIFFIFSVNMKVTHKCKEGVGCDKDFCLQ